MFIRIVKMTFEPEKIADFLANFEMHKNAIRHFEGCHFLELYRGRDIENIFFTYSFWEDEEALEAYRASALFREVWSATKQWFSEKPEAWSVDKIESLP
ncbi:putative quinol monooxygenase [Ascidiimonas aurantiaca]|uniref:putative quinol monooxygenase n=1 Tax=Ascidiimonas aurantiaca TaxID=1685432 RepID=UPI0030EDFC26